MHMSDEKKQDILEQQLDADELNAVSGGKAQGNGNCSKRYYTKPCTATVEQGSWCRKDDFCHYKSSIYSSPYDCDMGANSSWGASV